MSFIYFRRPVLDFSRALRAELIGCNIAVAEGITARGPTPILQLCRLLITAGHDPGLRLECYRGNTLALTVNGIGQGAKLEVNAHGTDFIAFRKRRAGSRMRQKRRRAL